MSATSTMSPVEVVDVVARLAAVVRRQIGYAEMGAAQRHARPLLDAALLAAGVKPDGPPSTFWRPLAGGLVDYAPGVFISQPILEAGEVSLLTLPSGRAAHLKVTGSYAGLSAAWEHLFQACAERTLAGQNWEVYTAAGSDGGETDLYALLA